MKRALFLICVVGLVVPSFAEINPEVTMNVSYTDPVSESIINGEIVIELFESLAPITVANFLNYVNDGFYDGLIFHRVMEGFMIQGGGFDQDLNEITPTYEDIDNEFSLDRSNLRGTLAMAKLGGNPDSATSQFFINLGDNSDNLDNQNGGFTVFAEVISGMEIVDAIAGLLTGQQISPDVGPMQDVPDDDVVINSAVVSVVPEPATVFLLGMGGLTLFKRRK